MLAYSYVFELYYNNFIIHVEHQCILALYCLCYLLRDVGIKADHQQIISFIPVNYIALYNIIVLY